MKDRNNRNILMTLLALLILVTAIVGITYAFFTYTRTGAVNNVITTGSVTFNFTETNQILLNNQVPVVDTVGQSLTGNSTFNFSIVGYNTAGGGINYTVYAVTGDAMDDKVRLRDNEIKLYLTDNISGGDTQGTINNNYATPKKVGAIGALTDGNDLVLCSGTINSTLANNPETHNYTLRMWIDSDVVIGTTYTQGEYGNLYYSLKVNVVANS